MARFVVVWLLLLATAWVAEPYVVAALFSAASPRPVTPRGSFTETEQTTIRVFQSASPSVFAQHNRSSPFDFDEQEMALQTGSGIIWDAAGHVVTNFHVINGTAQIGARSAPASS